MSQSIRRKCRPRLAFSTVGWLSNPSAWWFITESAATTHRYQLADERLRTALFYTRLYSRLPRPAMAPLLPSGHSVSQKIFRTAQAAIDTWCDNAHIPG